VSKVLCDKFRDEALRIFISGLKRTLTDVLFSAKPKDMPSSLALAQEVESNHERYSFATSFARSQEDRERKQFPKAQERQQAPPQTNFQIGAGKSANFTKNYKAHIHSAPRIDGLPGTAPEPMDVDPSLSKMLQPSRAPACQNAKTVASGRSGKALTSLLRAQILLTRHTPMQPPLQRKR